MANVFMLELMQQEYQTNSSIALEVEIQKSWYAGTFTEKVHSEKWGWE
jgi:hypothetical protein